jgi:hypothetical protein
MPGPAYSLILAADAPRANVKWVPPSGLTPPISAGASLVFSPVTLMEQIAANNAGGWGPDLFAATASSTTTGCGFYVFDASATHECLGVRSFWAGPAATVNAQLWRISTSNIGLITGASQNSQSVTIGAGPLEFSVMFAAPTTLLLGVYYVVSIFASTTPSYTSIGAVASATSITNAMLPVSSGQGPNYLGSAFHMFACPNGSNGQGSPFSLNANQGGGLLCPIGSSNLGFFPIEPIVQ